MEKPLDFDQVDRYRGFRALERANEDVLGAKEDGKESSRLHSIAAAAEPSSDDDRLFFSCARRSSALLAKALGASLDESDPMRSRSPISERERRESVDARGARDVGKKTREETSTREVGPIDGGGGGSKFDRTCRRCLHRRPLASSPPRESIQERASERIQSKSRTGASAWRQRAGPSPRTRARAAARGRRRGRRSA